ncbi:MAG: aldolase/citrate lyase family protein [Actinomycetota bacterium]
MMRRVLNPLLDRLRDDSAPVQHAIFLQLADPMVAEICAGAGFELVVIDTEHGPSGTTDVISQLQAIAAGGADAAVRVANHDPAVVKRVLDAGAITLIVPMVDDADEAREVVAATRYPPQGVRGAASARAARWGRIADYRSSADDGICLITMIETPAAIENIDAICSVDGVDVAFVGPTDLATAMGGALVPTDPEVVEQVERAIGLIVAAGGVAGVFAATPSLAARYAAAGAKLVGCGVDANVLAAATDRLRDSFDDRSM